MPPFARPVGRDRPHPMESDPPRLRLPTHAAAFAARDHDTLRPAEVSGERYGGRAPGPDWPEPRWAPKGERHPPLQGMPPPACRAATGRFPRRPGPCQEGLGGLCGLRSHAVRDPETCLPGIAWIRCAGCRLSMSDTECRMSNAEFRTRGAGLARLTTYDLRHAICETCYPRSRAPERDARNDDALVPGFRHTAWLSFFRNAGSMSTPSPGVSGSVTTPAFTCMPPTTGSTSCSRNASRSAYFACLCDNMM